MSDEGSEPEILLNIEQGAEKKEIEQELLFFCINYVYTLSGSITAQCEYLRTLGEMESLLGQDQTQNKQFTIREIKSQLTELAALSPSDYNNILKFYKDTFGSAFEDVEITTVDPSELSIEQKKKNYIDFGFRLLQNASTYFQNGLTALQANSTSADINRIFGKYKLPSVISTLGEISPTYLEKVLSLLKKSLPEEIYKSLPKVQKGRLEMENPRPTQLNLMGLPDLIGPEEQ